MHITVSEAAEAAGGRLIQGDGNSVLSHISLNSGEMRGDDLFVPIIGERVDAHRFIGKAFENGAVCAFTAEHHSAEEAAAAGLGMALGSASTGRREPALIAVSDTRKALQALGRWYRENIVRIPFVGVTGSVGKTTTREMIACALSSEKRVYATKGNSNSQVGVPITVLETDETAEIGVAELGMSEFGEMHRISEVARVNAAVMTNIGVSHINQLKTQENILIEKLHILDGMPDGAALLLNGDDPYLSGLTEERIHAYGIAEGKHISLLFYGTGENADYRAEELRLEAGLPVFRLRKRDGSLIPMRLQAAGMHMVLNAAAAVAAAELFSVDPCSAAEALSHFSGVSGRGETYERGGVRFIDDSYNAAPASMKAGLSVLCELPAEGRRIAVLADMLELGEQEGAYHEEVGSFIREKGLSIDLLLLYGPLSQHIAEGAGGAVPEIQHFSALSALTETLLSVLRPGDIVLFKGSNGMGLRKTVQAVLEAFGKSEAC